MTNERKRRDLTSEALKANIERSRPYYKEGETHETEQLRKCILQINGSRVLKNPIAKWGFISEAHHEKRLMRTEARLKAKLAALRAIKQIEARSATTASS